MFVGCKRGEDIPEANAPIGEKQDRPFDFSFNSLIKVDFQGSRITSDGGLLLVRELDERLVLNDIS